jgi:hypothetical protein
MSSVIHIFETAECEKPSYVQDPNLVFSADWDELCTHAPQALTEAVESATAILQWFEEFGVSAVVELRPTDNCNYYYTKKVVYCHRSDGNPEELQLPPWISMLLFAICATQRAEWLNDAEVAPICEEIRRDSKTKSTLYRICVDLAVPGQMQDETILYLLIQARPADIRQNKKLKCVGVYNVTSDAFTPIESHDPITGNPTSDVTVGVDNETLEATNEIRQLAYGRGLDIEKG